MDKIIRSLICDGQVSLAVLETTELVNEAIKIHSVQPAAAEILGCLLSCAAYMASGLKSDGCISFTVKAKDGDGAVSVSSDGELHVRGYVDGSCKHTLKGGTLTVVREEGRGVPFVGTCEIESDDISDALSAYFQQSEQIPTVVRLAVKCDEGGGCVYSGGAIMQLLPDADDAQIERAAEALDEYSLNRAFDGAETEYEKYFSSLAYGERTTLFPEYRCNCSERKIISVLSAVGKEELLKICAEEGEVKVHCHYCNKDYVFDERRIEESFVNLFSGGRKLI